MSASTFIDTNVLVYAYSNDDLLKKAQALVSLQAANAWLSTQVFLEFANVYSCKLEGGRSRELLSGNYRLVYQIKRDEAIVIFGVKIMPYCSRS